MSVDSLVVASAASRLALARLLEQYVSLGIFVVAGGLGLFSFLAWRRERDRRLAVVTAGYTMFAVYGLTVFLEFVLAPYVSPVTLELFEHASGVLILGGLLTFFLALSRW